MYKIIILLFVSNIAFAQNLIDESENDGHKITITDNCAMKVAF